MKLLCVYDPGLLFIRRSARVPHEIVRKIIDSFNEHERLRGIWRFKFTVSDTFYELLATEPDLGEFATWEVLDSLIQIMLLYPEENSPDYCIVSQIPEVPFESEPQALFHPHTSADPDLTDASLRLLGACFEHELHPRVCYATGTSECGFTEAHTVNDGQGRTLYVVRDLFEWSEQYRLLRKGHGGRLPNEYSPIPEGESAWFCFCPANATLQEEHDDLEAEELNDDSVRTNNWHRVAGRHRGYKDCWGNMWMWNDAPAQQHWDVQITRRFQNLIGARDSHINVQPATLDYPHADPIPQGSVRHGLGDFDPAALCSLGCPHQHCPRKGHQG